MYDVILVDDEELSLDELKYILEEHDDIRVVETFVNPVNALDKIEKIKPDMVFLDVFMPCMNGFELARKILESGLDSCLVFVTAYDEHALKAFDVEAVDYIIKPFSKNRIDKTISRIRKRLRERDKKAEKSKPDNVLEKNSIIKDLKWIPAADRGSIVLLGIDEIYYCSTEDKKTYVHTKDNCFPTELSLTKIEEKYRNKHLFRCHKSYIVNLDYVYKIIPMFNQNFIIELKGMNAQIPVSRHYARNLKILLGL